MDQGTLHKTYQIPHVTHKFAHTIRESKHMTYTIAHIVYGFGRNVLHIPSVT